MMVGNGGAPASVSISYTDIQGLADSVVTNSGSTVDWGLGNINLDPQFTSPGSLDALRVYTEGDYHLLASSPCIDAGDPAFAVAPDATDIDGNLRVLGAKVDMGADEFDGPAQSPINAIVKVTPKILNLTSSGNWISCTISLPDGCDIGDVVVDSIRLNGKISPVETEVNKQGRKLHVKFDRHGTQGMLMDVEGSVLLKVTGNLEDGTAFQGQDTIKIARANGNK